MEYTLNHRNSEGVLVQRKFGNPALEENKGSA